MDSYFKFNEIGQIKSILKDQYNLWGENGPSKYVRKPLFDQKAQLQSKVEDIDSSFYGLSRGITLGSNALTEQRDTESNISKTATGG
jgi:hypothetical protein